VRKLAGECLNLNDETGREKRALILESNDEVIRISQYDDLSPSMTLAPLLHR
jgi:hypothetical protein